MKKKILVTLLLAVLVLVSCQGTNYEQLKSDFDNLLNTGSYDSAYSLYSAADDETINYYNQSLDTYSNNLIADSGNMTLEDAKSALTNFLVFERTKLQIQDALDRIAAYEEVLAVQEQNYLNGVELYNSGDYDGASQILSSVGDYYENYQSAQDLLSQIDARNSIWESAAVNNEAGRNPSVNSLAYKGGYMYFPVDADGIHSIVKHNYATGETQLFPLLNFVGTFHIKGINVVGDYIYFIAGEELGTGVMLDSPYNIYEMKTDGTGLTLVKEGDYFDLISKGDAFYALSYTKGLVKMDKYFQSEKVISDKWIIEMQVTDAGIYYTEKLENTYNSEHVLYLYKDGQSKEVMREELLHTYFFGGFSIYYHDLSTSNLSEEIYIADANVQNSDRLAILKSSTSDMGNLIGVVGDKVVFNGKASGSSASMRHNMYTEIQISNKKVYSYQDRKIVPDYEVLNVLYEENVMLVQSSDGTYSLTATPNSNPLDHVISIPVLDSAALETNMSIISENRPSDEDFYSAEEIVVELDNFWYYSSPTLNVTIEKIYDEVVETLVYVTNIRTKDLTGFNIGYSNLSPPGAYTSGVKTDDIAQINQAVFATNGDFALNSKNNWIGKTLRDGRVFDATAEGIKEYDVNKVYSYKIDSKDFLVMYPDGVMTAYSKNDGITVGELVDAGVKNTLSFGPILVQDNKKTDACTDHDYYIGGANPRCAWGMVEPGHYVNIVADGRQPGVCRGMSYYTLSEYFQTLGCSVAYNLDGGQTAAVAFMGRFLNTHQNDNNGEKWVNHRPVQEIVYFGTSSLVPYNLENYYEE